MSHAKPVEWHWIHVGSVLWEQVKDELPSDAEVRELGNGWREIRVPMTKERKKALQQNIQSKIKQFLEISHEPR